jgi:hypothetical protein
MKDITVRRHCLDQFARIAAKLNEPLADDEVTALVLELAIIRAMFEWTETVRNQPLSWRSPRVLPNSGGGRSRVVETGRVSEGAEGKPTPSVSSGH